MIEKMPEVRPIYVILFILAVAAGIFFTVINRKRTSVVQPTSVVLQNSQANKASVPQEPNTSVQNQTKSDNTSENQSSLAYFQPPLDRAGERVTKKPFGIFITPQNSPVQPEKFTGYHTGVDFEIFSEELNVDVAVRAVCSGKLLRKEYATGYGGVAVESCEINNQITTVIYGHLKLASIKANAGDDLHAGNVLGVLGEAFSTETNGERKHLHLGFHKDSSINILGYVQNKTDLSKWIDPCLYVCQD